MAPFGDRVRQGGPARQTGFTLLEVLTALVVLGFVLAALSAGMRFGRQATNMQQRLEIPETAIRPVDETIRALIERAWPDAGGANARFVGTARTVSFRTRMPDSLPATRGRDADVTIGVDTAHRLTLTWLPWYRNWFAPSPRPARIELLPGVDHIDIAYWDPALHLPPGGWAAAWDGPGAPRLVRIRLVFPKGAGLHWPDIIVATERNAWAF